MALTRPRAAQVNFDVTNITDPLIRLNSGQTGANDKDSGIVIERGSDTNVAIIWDESADQLAIVNTTEDGSTSGNVTVSSYANVRANAFYGDGSNLTGIDAAVYGDSDVASYLSSNGYGTSSSIIASITDSAPSTLDTLNELAAALGDDANFSTTVTNSIATKLSLTGGTVTGDVTLSSNADLVFQDKNGTFPTSSGGFFWDLNNDEARIYAEQPASDQIDFFFKISDNVGSTDRFVYWIDDYRGSTYDKYPAQFDGSAQYLGIPVDGSGNKDLANARFKVPYSGDVGIDGNKVWHAGNDGSGSGLDADTLDGLNTISSGNYWGGIPTVGNDGVMEVGKYIDFHGSDTDSSDYTTRLEAISTTDLRLGGSKIWTQGNDGSGSGLDADLLDGNHASAFSTLSGSNTFSGLNRFSNLRFADATTNDYNDYDELTAILHRKESASAFRPVSNIEYWNGSSWVSTTALDAIIPTLLTGDSQNEGSIPNTYKRFRFTIQLSATWLGGFWIVSERHWSGDGDISRSYDMKLELGDSSMSTINNTSSFTVGADVYGYNKLLTWHYPNNYMRVEYDFGTYTGDIPLVRFDAFNVYGRGSGGLSGDTPFNWNSTTLNTPIPTLRLNGNTVWNAGNDGSGSGLDADTVDGIQASSFLRSDANDTKTGNIVLQTSGAVTDTTTGLFFETGGGYTDGRYRTRFRKQDVGGGIPLYIDQSSGTANSYTAQARFGTYSGNSYEFEVFGDIKANGNVDVTGVFNGTATSSQYADLAEKYLADAAYPIGTVLEIGGDAEVTIASPDSYKIVGTISEKPGLLMNTGLEGEHVVPVAYIGRVPCRVQGTIDRGDFLVVGNTPGVAVAKHPRDIVAGQAIGKALESYNSNNEGIIEILVGRL